MQAELTRRSSFTAAVLAYFQARPGVWIPATELEVVGGRQAWRTRISDARQIVVKDGGAITNRVRRTTQDVERGGKLVTVVYGPPISEYRYRPQALGREADQIVVYADSHLGPLFDRVGAWQK